MAARRASRRAHEGPGVSQGQGRPGDDGDDGDAAWRDDGADVAARQGALESSVALAEAGADLNVADPDGTTALSHRHHQRHYEVAARLAQKGANPNIGDSSGMARALRRGGHAAPGAVHQPADAEAVGPADGGDLVKVLLEHGADPNGRLKAPLLMRQHNGGDRRWEGRHAVDARRKGERRGADARAARQRCGPQSSVEEQGDGADDRRVARGARRAALSRRTIDAVRLLAAKGADVNAVNEAGDTALHIAVLARRRASSASSPSTARSWI